MHKSDLGVNKKQMASVQTRKFVSCECECESASFFFHCALKEILYTFAEVAPCSTSILSLRWFNSQCKTLIFITIIMIQTGSEQKKNKQRI